MDLRSSPGRLDDLRCSHGHVVDLKLGVDQLSATWMQRGSRGSAQVKLGSTEDQLDDPRWSQAHVVDLLSTWGQLRVKWMTLDGGKVMWLTLGQVGVNCDSVR